MKSGRGLSRAIFLGVSTRFSIYRAKAGLYFKFVSYRLMTLSSMPEFTSQVFG